MKTCRACDAPLKVGANYCVVCGAKQHRLRGLHKRFRALEVALAALTCGAIAAAFSFGARKPTVHEVQSTAAVIALDPTDSAAPGRYLEQRAVEADQRDPVVTPQTSTNNNVFEPRELEIVPRTPTPTAATARSKHAKATLNERVGKDAATVQQPRLPDVSSKPVPASPSAESFGVASAAPTAPASLNPTTAATLPSQQPETGANEPVPASSASRVQQAATAAEELAPRAQRLQQAATTTVELAPLSSEIARPSLQAQPANVASQGRTSSQAEALVQGPRTVDEIYQQRTSRCGGGVIGLLCRGTMRLNVCDGRWTENEIAGMTICYVGIR
jgi:hypothetical protein